MGYLAQIILISILQKLFSILQKEGDILKGFKHQTNYDTKKSLTDNLILKSLPYGKWTTKNNEEYLFNRDFEPIAGWNLILNVSIPVTADTWINDIIEEKTEFYYVGVREYPTKSEKTLRKCWDILADWSERMEI